MTNGQDAYTLAARAAADRARAEVLHQGTTPTSPGLQNPMRRLSKNPAVRWLLSAVLLAAGTALAVDYLNTPLRAWMQYHAPVPGSGGKSVAEIAAEQAAAQQAKIDAEINAPAEAKARTDAFNASERLNDERRTKLSTELRVADAHVLYHPVESGFGSLFDGGIAVWPNWEDMHEIGGIDYTGFASTPLAPMPAGKFTPFVMADGKTIATVTEPDTTGQAKAVWVIGKLEDGHYGAILQSDLARLRIDHLLTSNTPG